jgi:epoxyqueuosine reductase
MTLTEQIRREAQRLGFDAVGVSLVTSDRPERARLKEWLARGHHGEMNWMVRTDRKRANPALLLPGIRSIVSVGMNYYTGPDPSDLPDDGRIARYARGDDYHRILGERLACLVEFMDRNALDSKNRAYVDTGPVMEKAWAQRAGLGWIGKHSNLVSRQHGSWLVLGEVLTTAALAPDAPGIDLCGNCTLCIRACPTGAITEPYVVDARRCISYWTIEQKGMLPEELHAAAGNKIFGCDDCLNVCPYNREAKATPEPRFSSAETTIHPDLQTLAQQSAEEFQAAFGKSAVRRATYEGLQRSVAVAIKNAAPRSDET